MFKDVLFSLIEPLIEKKTSISINESEKNNVVVLELSVDKVDFGKVIGREGRIIKMIRMILSAAGAKYNKKIIVELVG